MGGGVHYYLVGKAPIRLACQRKSPGGLRRACVTGTVFSALVANRTFVSWRRLNKAHRRTPDSACLEPFGRGLVFGGPGGDLLIL